MSFIRIQAIILLMSQIYIFWMSWGGGGETWIWTLGYWIEAQTLHNAYAPRRLDMHNMTSLVAACADHVSHAHPRTSPNIRLIIKYKVNYQTYI